MGAVIAILVLLALSKRQQPPVVQQTTNLPFVDDLPQLHFPPATPIRPAVIQAPPVGPAFNANPAPLYVPAPPPGVPIAKVATLLPPPPAAVVAPQVGAATAPSTPFATVAPGTTARSLMVPPSYWRTR